MNSRRTRSCYDRQNRTHQVFSRLCVRLDTLIDNFDNDIHTWAVQGALYIICTDWLTTHTMYEILACAKFNIGVARIKFGWGILFANVEWRVFCSINGFLSLELTAVDSWPRTTNTRQPLLPKYRKLYNIQSRSTLTEGHYIIWKLDVALFSYWY